MTLVISTLFCFTTLLVVNGKVLLISFDGVRHDFAGHDGEIPAFTHLQRNGVRAKYLKPPFPTFTSPSHFTIATGLYVDAHGVIANDKINVSEPPPVTYYPTYYADDWWDAGGEPIWITAVKQGLRSGGHLYPGSYVKIQNRTATKRVLYGPDSTEIEEDWRNYIDKIFKWFVEDELDVVAAYFADPDVQSHVHGPVGKHVTGDVMSKVNRTIFYVLDQAEKAGLAESLDIIIVSDHGLAAVEPIGEGEEISLLDHVDEAHIDYIYVCGSTAFIEPKPELVMQVYGQLKEANLKIEVYLRDEIPERWHFRHPRLTSIFVVAHKGHLVYSKFTGTRHDSGMHGYDNDEPDMWGIYFSIGPSFKENLTVEGFESIHIYPLMAHLLGLKAAPNNGSFAILSPTLRAPTSGSNVFVALWFVLSTSALCLVLRWTKKSNQRLASIKKGV